MLNILRNWRHFPTNDWFLLSDSFLEWDLAIFFHVNRYIRVINVYNTANTINTHTPGRCHAWNFLVYKKLIYINRPAIPSEKSITNTPSQPTWVQKVILTVILKSTISRCCLFFSFGAFFFLFGKVNSTSFGSVGLSGMFMENDNGWWLSPATWWFSYMVGKIPRHVLYLEVERVFTDTQ